MQLAVSALGWAGLAGLGPAGLCEKALCLGAMARPSHAARPVLAERCVVKGSSCVGCCNGSLKVHFFMGRWERLCPGRIRASRAPNASLAQPLSVMFRHAQNQIPYGHRCSL